MEDSGFHAHEWLTPAKTVARRLMTIGENRLELLAVEVQEERDHLLRALLIAFGILLCAVLALVMLTAAIVIGLWAWSPVGVLLIVAGVYALAGVCLYGWLHGMMQNWQSLSASLDQLRKDRECLEKILT